MGFNILKPLLKTGSRVVGEGFGEVDGLGIRRGWWDGWLDGWMDGWVETSKLRLLILAWLVTKTVTHLSRESKLELRD